MMQADPVVAEVRKLRELRAARFGFDIRSIVKDAQERDAVGDRAIIHRDRGGLLCLFPFTTFALPWNPVASPRPFAGGVVMGGKT